MTEDQSRLNNYFLWLLAQKDYSAKVMTTKALAKNYSQEDIDLILSDLQSKKFQSDRRMGENYVEFYKNQKGKIWLTQKLSIKGLERDLIAELLAGFDEIEKDYGKLKVEMERKYRIDNWQELDYTTYAKILSFLQRRGFFDASKIVNEWKNQI